jgi:hypothetical protein
MSALLLRAVDALNDRLMAALAIGEALDLAGGAAAPAWVQVYRTQLAVVSEAAETLETLIRRGIGVVDPDEAKRHGIERGNDQ